MRVSIMVLVLFLVACTPDMNVTKVGDIEELECVSEVVFACEQGKKNILCNVAFMKPECDFTEKSLLPTVTPTPEGDRQ